MKIKVQYFGQVRALAKKREEEAKVSSGAKVLRLLQELAQAYGEAFGQEVLEDDGKNVRDGLIVTVNGKAIEQLDGVRTGLNFRDVVALLPLFAGGG